MYLKFLSVFYGIILFVFNTIKLINTKNIFEITDLDIPGGYEADIFRTLEGYLKQHQMTLDILNSKVVNYKSQNTKAHEKKFKYYSNPIFALRMIRQFSIDWYEIEKFVENEDSNINIHYLRNTLNFPSRNDFTYAVEAFLSLQHFYDLDITKIAQGELNGIQYNTSLVLDDCLGLAFVSFENKKYCDSVKWIRQGLLLLDNVEVNAPTTQIRIFLLKILFNSYFELGDIKSALVVKHSLLELSPNVISQDDQKKLDGLVELDPQITELEENQRFNELCYKPETSSEYKYEEYNKLCTKKFKRPSEIVRKLYCRLINNNNPFLIIGPFKQEILNFQPLIYLYHDVLYNKEIDIIKKIAKPHFKFYNEHDPGIAKRRTGKKIMINSTKLDFLKRRAKTMTGLDIHPNDKLAVQKFEISTKSTPHFDSLKEDMRISESVKYTTLIYFMSDIEQGGATVFPDIGIYVKPKKGLALFWHNTFPTGYLDFRSLHAGCPVLVGSKWMVSIHLQEIAHGN